MIREKSFKICAFAKFQFVDRSMLEWYTVPIKRKYTQPIKTLDKERNTP